MNQVDDVEHFDLHSQINKDIAVTERVCQSNVTESYNPDLESMRHIIEELAERIRPHMKPFQDIFNLDAMDEYIDTRNGYTRKQKNQIKMVRRDAELIDWLTMLREKWDELYFDSEGVLHMRGLKNPIAKKSRFRAFIKDESYDKLSRPRNITGASDVDKYILGVVFGEFNHAFFSLPETIKKIPYDLRPKVITERLGQSNYVYVLDHTAFESAATLEIQEACEQYLYRLIYPEFEPYAKKYADPLIFACGRVDPSLYCVDTSRASGAPNTSLGNSINNFVFIKLLEQHSNAQFKFLVEGDDCVINSNVELDLAETKRFALINGFDLKIDECEHYCKSGFLSMQWDCDNYVVDSTNHWKHIVDAVTFRPQQVFDKNTLSQRAYWKIQTSKLLSLTLLNPKHELFYLLFEGSYRYYCKYLGHKQVKIKDRQHKNISFNSNVTGAKLLSRVYEHMEPELFGETRSIYGYSIQDVDYIKRLLMVDNEYAFEKALNIIVNFYHTRDCVYYKQPVFLLSGQQ